MRSRGESCGAHCAGRRFADLVLFVAIVVDDMVRIQIRDPEWDLNRIST